MSELVVEDLAEGAGPAARPGDVLTVHYTGWLEDGREFDASRARGPFELTLGRGEVIKGWDRGLEGMRAGGRRRLVVPPELAYGSRGFAGLIPPQATLVFEIELLRIG